MSINCWNCNEVNASNARNCSYCNGPNDRGAPFVFDPFKVVGYQGHGTYGTVYKCFDPRLQRFVAVKRLDLQNLGPGGSAQIESEIRHVASLSSENIVHIYDVGSTGGSPYFVMEFIDGKSLAELIKDDPDAVRNNFNNLFIGICEGLRIAHSKRIIHRDVKPENIMIANDGRVKITDFGLAKLITTSSPPMSRVGTPLYMAPEVWKGEQYDERVDIWALAVICYYIWTGEHPFEANTYPALWLKIDQGKYELPESINSEIPAEIAAMIKHMLVKKEDRVASVEILQNQIRALAKENTSLPNKELDDYQKEIDAIYGYKNIQRAPILLLSHLSTNVAGIIGGFQSLPTDYGKARAKYYLPKSFAWLCAVLSAINCTIEELIWLKFPEKCPYCEGQECSCDEKRDKTEPDINQQLLEKVRDSQAESKEGRSFAFYKNMFNRIYGERNKRDGINTVALRLFLEINEAADALLQIDSLKSFDSIDVMHLEMADVIAWFFGLLNVLETESGILEPDYDFEAEFFDMFNDRCYKCQEPKCRCAEITKEIKLFNWRSFK